MARSTFVYVTYIRTTPEKLWSALTDDMEFMKQYWFGGHCDSNWKAGSAWTMYSADGAVTDAGEILESVPLKRLVIKWRNEWRPELKAEGYSRCVFDIEQMEGAVKLTVTHGVDGEGRQYIEAVSGGWPKILSNLKSVLETGHAVMTTKGGCKGQAA